jgi:hypothetical protein
VSDSRDKYVLGPVVIDGADLIRAVAVQSQVIGMAGWHVDFKLTPEATKRFVAATTAAVGKLDTRGGETFTSPTRLDALCEREGATC